MAIEIERKFLPSGDGWRNRAAGVQYRQGYLTKKGGATVRVRVAGDTGYLTVKGPTANASRLEFEYAIPLADANEMLDRLTISPIVQKIRYTVDHGGFIWEIDEFLGENKGLIVAEIELETPDQSFPMPPWIGREVTGDPRYYNASLAAHPYRSWKKTTE